MLKFNPSIVQYYCGLSSEGGNLSFQFSLFSKNHIVGLFIISDVCHCNALYIVLSVEVHRRTRNLQLIRTIKAQKHGLNHFSFNPQHVPHYYQIVFDLFGFLLGFPSRFLSGP